jgi:hypothetical protein
MSRPRQTEREGAWCVTIASDANLFVILFRFQTLKSLSSFAGCAMGPVDWRGMAEDWIGLSRNKIVPGSMA